MPPVGPLVRSRFLVRVPREDGDATYFHSLFGTSLVLNPAAEALLDRWRPKAGGCRWCWSSTWAAGRPTCR
jgi:hypothetical protein